MGYTFEGRYNRGAPRDAEYTFTIKAKDENGNYSEPSSITVQHPGIQQLVLEEQDVQGLIASIKINLPKAFSETSQTVYPYDEKSEEKDILGYRLHIQEVDDNHNPVGNEEIINYDIEELEDRIIYYQAETGKIFKVRVGAYDSVYHYNWSPSLYNSTISDPVYVETFKIRFIDIDESLISPNGLTETLRNPGVDVYELQDKYTWIVGKNVDGEDIIGGIGLEVNEAAKKVDIQFVADSFKLFPTDENGDIIEGEDKAVFAVDTTPEGSTIFMDANQIGIRASKDDGSGEYNFFVLDGEGLEIFTENFKLDKNGNALFSGEIQSEQFSLISDKVKIDNDGITVTGDGFYSRLDDQGLYLYKEGEDDPYWYCKNVASGIAQDGDYIELNWKRKPKVITAISSFQSFDINHSESDQTYKIYTDNPTKDGFHVYGKRTSSSAQHLYDTNYRFRGNTPYGGGYRTQEWVSEYTLSNSVTKLQIYLYTAGTANYSVSHDPWRDIILKIYYQKEDDSSWIYCTTYSTDDKKNVTFTLSKLSPARYRFKIICKTYGLSDAYGNSGYDYVDVKSWKDWSVETTIPAGKISWIAIEGGVDD